MGAAERIESTVKLRHIERLREPLISLLAFPVFTNLLFPGEIHVWSRWLVVAVCFVLAGGMTATWLLLRDDRRPPIARIPAPLVLLVLVAAASTLFTAVNTARSRDFFFMLVAYVTIYMAFRESTDRMVRPFLWGIWVVSTCIALYGVYQYFFLWEGMIGASASGLATTPSAAAIQARVMTRRVFSVFPLPTILCDFLAMTFPVNVSLLLSIARKRLWMVALTLSLAIQLWALLLTRSFTGFLSLALCAGVLYAATGNTLQVIRRHRILTAGITVFFLVALVFLLYTRGIILVESIVENPLALRMINWRIGVSQAIDHPILGVGPDNYQTLYTRYMRPGDSQARHAHSAPIEMFAELGVVGGVAFVLLLLRWLRLSWRALRRDPGGALERKGIALAIIALVAQNLLDIGIYLPSLGILSFMLIGLLESEPARDISSTWSPRARVTPLFRWLLVALSVLVGIGGAFLSRRLMFAQLSYREALALYAEGRITEAEQKVQAAISLDPLAYQPVELLASHLLALAPTDPAEAVVARSLYYRAIRLSPLTASLHRGMSAACAASGQPFMAYVHSIQVIELRPADKAAADRRDAMRDRLQQEIGP